MLGRFREYSCGFEHGGLGALCVIFIVIVVLVLTVRL
ncbi:hypothetical protein [Sedimentimonas flavescens]